MHRIVIESDRLWASLFVMSLAVLGCAGCGSSTEPPPGTYSARGKVFYQDNTAMRGGTIQFQPVSDGNGNLFAEIEEDGSFTLSTIVDNKKVPGAREGKYRVTILPPLTQTTQDIQPIQVTEVYTVKPGENYFSIKIDSSRQTKGMRTP